MTFTSIPPSLRPVVEDVAKRNVASFCMASWLRMTDLERRHQMDKAEAAILAFLNACVERGVGHGEERWDGVQALILNLGTTDDTA